MARKARDVSQTPATQWLRERPEVGRALPKVHLNGGRRGFLVGIDPEGLSSALGAKPVHCAL